MTAIKVGYKSAEGFVPSGAGVVDTGEMDKHTDKRHIKPVKIRTQQPFKGLIRNVATGQGPFVIGMDSTYLFARDVNTGGLRQCSDTVNWSPHKTMPTDVAWNNCIQMLTFKNKHYLIAMETTSGNWCIFRTDPQIGGTAWSWSKVHTFRAGTVGYGTSMTASATTLIASEYGDPVGGPAAYRTTDGTTWTMVYGPDPAMRHIHAVEYDPYNVGHVWMTCGDGIGKTVQKSIDDGLTWQIVVASAGWQAVQISFDQDWVYLASDSGSHTFHVVDRSTGTPYVGTPNTHRNIAVPGPLTSLNDMFSINAYRAAVDPATGFYYACANESGTNTWNGLFFTPRVGMPIQLLDRGFINNNFNGRVYIAQGHVWCGIFHTPLLTV